MDQKFQFKLEWVVFVALAVLLLPLVNLGFFWDDNVFSSIRGAMQLCDCNFFQWVTTCSIDMLRDMGRFYPLSNLTGLLLYPGDRVLYHLIVYILILINMASAGVLFSLLTKSSEARVWTYLWALVMIQMRMGPDPHHGYAGLLQLHWLAIEWAFIFFIHYLEKQQSRNLILSVFLYSLSLFTYEISYPYFILFITLGCHYLPFKRSVRVCVPYLLMSVFGTGVTLMLRSLVHQPLLGGHPNYTPYFDLGASLLTLLRHMSAAIPLSFTLLSGFRTAEPVSLSEIASQLGGFSPVFSAVIALGAILYLSLHYREQGSKTFTIPSRSMLLWGVLLWVLPGLLISLSAKYQNPGWISWGTSYLPIYESYFGVMFLGVLVSLKIQAKWNNGSKNHFGIAIGTIWSLAVFWTAASNGLILGKLNAWFRPDREVAEMALQNGFFSDLPDQGYLFLNTKEFPGGNTAFYRQNSGKTFRRIAGPGRFLGEPHNERTAAIELYVPRDFEWMPPPSAQPVGLIFGRKHFLFRSEDKVAYWDYQSFGLGQGFAILGEPQEMEVSSDQIFSAKALSARLFVWRLSPQALPAVRNPDLNITPLVMEKEWSILEVRSKSSQRIELTDFKVR